MKEISMNVEELIKELSKYPPTMKVYFNSDGCYDVAVGSVELACNRGYPENDGLLLDCGFEEDVK